MAQSREGGLGAMEARLARLVDWERRKRAQMRVSTEPARRLLELLGNPDEGLRVVHVTGSKGKGSTSALIAAGLAASGLRVGRYGSPHVERINERVVLDGREVGDELLEQALTSALDAREALLRRSPGVDPTWFDVVTAAALWCFRRARVDWVVAEVGLGGRLDSTNVLRGEVCVITNVELEHCAVLGATRAAIAAEKAGIVKAGSTLVTELVELDEAGAVVAARARELDVGILRPAVRVDGRRATVEQRNAALAELALEALCARGVRGPSGQPLVTRLDAGLLSAARLPARQERFVAGACPVVLDGAHTPGSVAAVLSDLWAATDLHGRPSVVLGMARDKDLAGILKVLAPAAEKVFGTSVGTELHRTPDEIAAAARAVGVEAQSASSPRAALDLALAHARSRGSWVLIVGSLYLAGALRPELRHIDP